MVTFICDTEVKWKEVNTNNVMKYKYSEFIEFTQFVIFMNKTLKVENNGILIYIDNSPVDDSENVTRKILSYPILQKCWKFVF